MLKGTVKDAITGETLPNANIYESDATGKYTAGAKGTTTNEQGIYQFATDPTGSHITASYTGYERQTKPRADIVTFELTTAASALPEVVIKARAWWPYIAAFAAAALIAYFVIRKAKP